MDLRAVGRSAARGSRRRRDQGRASAAGRSGARPAHPGPGGRRRRSEPRGRAEQPRQAQRGDRRQARGRARAAAAPRRGSGRLPHEPSSRRPGAALAGRRSAARPESEAHLRARPRARGARAGRQPAELRHVGLLVARRRRPLAHAARGGARRRAAPGLRRPHERDEPGLRHRVGAVPPRAQRRALGRGRLAAGHRDVGDVVGRRLQRQSRLRPPRGHARARRQPVDRHLPHARRPLPRARHAAGRPPLGGLLSPPRPPGVDRRSPLRRRDVPDGRTPRRARATSRRSSRRGRWPSGGSSSPAWTRRGSRSRASASCAKTPRRGPTATSPRSKGAAGERYELVSNPCQFDESVPELAPAPECGAHTEEVLLELGLDWDEIGALRSDGVL